MVNALHTVLVLAFLGVTSTLLALTVARRLRIRGVAFSWKAARPSRLPVWPILFMGVVAVLYVYAANAIPEIAPDIFTGYLVGAMLWLMSSLLSGTVFVTRYGIVRDALRSDASVAWVQVYDYFEASEGRGVVFVFMYESADGSHRRLEVAVPKPYVEVFRRYVRNRLEEPQAIVPERTVGRQALEG